MGKEDYFLPWDNYCIKQREPHNIQPKHAYKHEEVNEGFKSANIIESWEYWIILVTDVFQHINTHKLLG